MLKKYTQFKLNTELDLYFNGDIAVSDISFINDLNESVSFNIKDKINDVFDNILTKWLPKIKDGAHLIANKALKLISWIFNKIVKFVKKNDTKIIALIVMLLIMMTITVVSVYAGGNPNDPEVAELANVALAWLSDVKSNILNDNQNISQTDIRMAEAILTSIRNFGDVNIDYAGASDNAQGLVKSAYKIASDIKTDDPNLYSTLIEKGQGIASVFTRSINGTMKTFGSLSK